MHRSVKTAAEKEKATKQEADLHPVARPHGAVLGIRITSFRLYRGIWFQLRLGRGVSTEEGLCRITPCVREQLVRVYLWAEAKHR
ncbi:Sialic Acid-Binding Ig-Like Lectin 5 [Manis pentadactyla]|nr:Sialic Acid-Binding Ig-Like Lectin 5 [Manis pentadactyla]